MKIVIIHYHLNRGGVTRVVLNQLAALDRVITEPIDVLLLSGGRVEGLPRNLAQSFTRLRLTIESVQGLDYDPQLEVDSEVLTSEVLDVFRRHGIAPSDSVLHVHNHSLGKNVAWLLTLNTLIAQGFAALLQIHDFAEDGRPRNYELYMRGIGREKLGPLLYPQSSATHYATLNRRDYGILESAGVASRRLHFLPNPVGSLPQIPDRIVARTQLEQRCQVPRDQRYLLYPVRGIRRKNVGEIVLWSVLSDGNTTFGITLEPENPAEKPAYESWKNLVEQRQLPVRFETGSQLSFEENLAAADAVITTSVAEGFGMVFLEAWLANLSLLGRDLPEITADFRDAGVLLDGLYREIPIPTSWFDEPALECKMRSAIERMYQAYGLAAMSDDQWKAYYQTKCGSGFIDFADLDEVEQTHVVTRLVDQPGLRRELPNNSLRFHDDESVRANINVNRSAIDSEYSLVPSGNRLWDLYQELAGSPRSQQPSIDSSEILREFLAPHRMRLIRT